MESSSLLSVLARGLLIGFSIAAPVGPIGILVIRRSLDKGWRAGLVSGLGAASADAVYGSIAALGLTAISVFLIHQGTLLRLIGGAFLVYLGVRTFLSRPANTPPQATDKISPPGESGIASAYISTFFLTITNPLTILSFTAVFAGLGLASSTSDSAASALTLVMGVFGGSAAWWFILSGLTSLFRSRFLRPAAMVWVNRISGLILIGFGLAALVSVAFRGAV
jgi:threonine/homoserine/homoserine lactone efflux protein